LLGTGGDLTEHLAQPSLHACNRLHERGNLIAAVRRHRDGEIAICGGLGHCHRVAQASAEIAGQCQRHQDRQGGSDHTCTDQDVERLLGLRRTGALTLDQQLALGIDDGRGQFPQLIHERLAGRLPHEQLHALHGIQAIIDPLTQCDLRLRCVLHPLTGDGVDTLQPLLLRRIVDGQLQRVHKPFPITLLTRHIGLEKAFLTRQGIPTQAGLHVGQPKADLLDIDDHIVGMDGLLGCSLRPIEAEQRDTDHDDDDQHDDAESGKQLVAYRKVVHQTSPERGGMCRLQRRSSTYAFLTAEILPT
jgi:hypothetical protein